MVKKRITFFTLCIVLIFIGGIIFFPYQEKSMDKVISFKEEQFDSLLFTQNYSDIEDTVPKTENIDAAKELLDFLSDYTVKKDKSSSHQGKLLSWFVINHSSSKTTSVYLFEDHILSSKGNWTYYNITDGPIDSNWLDEWEERYFTE